MRHRPVPRASGSIAKLGVCREGEPNAVMVVFAEEKCGPEVITMRQFALAAAIAAALTGTGYGQPQSTTSGSTASASSPRLTHFYVINYYRQNVYGSSGTKIAEVRDTLVGADGKIDG